MAKTLTTLTRAARQLGPSILCGLLLTASFPPAGWAPLAFFALLPLLSSCDESAGKRLLKGWLAGFTMQCSMAFWIITTIRDFGGQPTWVALVGACLFWAYQGLDLALFTLLAGWLHRPFRAAWQKAAVLAASFYVIQIEIFPYVFPWNLGSALSGTPLLGAAGRLWGANGITFWVAFIGFAVILGRRSKDHRRWGLPAILALFVLCMGGLIPVPQPDQRLRVGVVQPNLIPLAKRGTLSAHELFEAHAEPTRNFADRVDLVAWPETALPFPLNQAPLYQDALQKLAEAVRAPLVIGTVGSQDGNLFSNEIWLFVPQQSPQQYKKGSLVLFSERLPWVLSWAKYFDPNLGAFEGGKEHEALRFGDVAMIPLVCFEAIRPRYVQEFEGNLIVNLTNDAWFGESKASSLHLQHLLARSEERRMPLVRATNSGISCWVDPQGQIHGATPLYQPASPIYEIAYTSYVPKNWSALGMTAIRLLVWVVILLSLLAHLRLMFGVPKGANTPPSTASK